MSSSESIAADAVTAASAKSESKAAKRGASALYTAIIYFHGMGTPRRHEEISRLIDALDQFAERNDIASVGRLRNQQVQFEPSRVEEDDDVAFVRLARAVKRFGDETRIEGRYRVYEGYWSPSTAGGFSALRVLGWLLFRFFNPFQVLLRPWRAHQRLKLACLYRLYSEVSDSLRDHKIRQIEGHYRNFENWDARRRFPVGSFGSFISYVRAKHARNDRTASALEELAREWRRRFIREQLTLIAVCFSLLVATINVVAMTVYLSASVAQLFGVDFARSMWLSDRFELMPYPAYVFPVLAAVLAYVVFKSQHYLSNFWSDVMFWTMRDEKDARFAKRREILRASERAILQVLRDPACKRVVVLGHSLGSAIAYETLLRLGRRKLARADGTSKLMELDRLNIISHLITIGSPIDRIHYFFELHDSRYHRYNRIHEYLQGDTNFPPFTSEGNRGTVWLNIWDDADPISSRLFAPRKRTPNRDEINDMCVPSSHLVNPIRAHSDYFFSLQAIRTIFWLSIFGRLPKETTDPAATELRSLLLKYARPAVWPLCTLMVWMIFAALVSLQFRWAWPLNVTLSIAALVAVILIVIQVCGWVADRRWPMRLDRP